MQLRSLDLGYFILHLFSPSFARILRWSICAWVQRYFNSIFYKKSTSTICIVLYVLLSNILIAHRIYIQWLISHNMSKIWRYSILSRSNLFFFHKTKQDLIIIYSIWETLVKYLEDKFVFIIWNKLEFFFYVLRANLTFRNFCSLTSVIVCEN